MSDLLLIDQNPAVHHLLDQHLSNMFDRILHTETGSKGVEIAMRERPELILLDALITKNENKKTFKALQKSILTQDIPVLFIADQRELSTVKVFSEKGYECITKPFDFVELRARIRGALRSNKMTSVIQANIDFLTGLYNKQYFEKQLCFSLEAYKKCQTPFALIWIDIDFFRRINETYGKLFGDRMLQKIAILLKACGNKKVKPCRFFGEKFAILINQAEEDKVLDLVTELLDNIRNLIVLNDYDPVTVSASMGICYVEPGIADICIKDVIACAKKSLSIAKKSGKDRYIFNHLSYSSLCAKGA